MRVSAFLLVASLLGVLFGGWLIGRWALGLAVIADSVAVGVFALLRDDGRETPSVAELPGVAGVLERARRAS